MLSKKICGLLIVFLLLTSLPSIGRAQTAVGEMMCACPGLSKPKGNAATCEEACSGRRSSGGPSTDAVSAVGTALGQALGRWLRGNPERQAELASRMAELSRRQQVEARLQREADSRRREDMFLRLNGELKLAGLPGLYLQGIESPQELRLKGLDQIASDSGGLKLKLGDDSTKGYGIAGLPGIYTSGPRAVGLSSGGDSTGEKSDRLLTLKLGDEETKTTSINGNSQGIGSHNSDADTPGIPGLPGIFLNGSQQSSSGIQQAKQLTLSAESLAGQERELAEGAALTVAMGDPVLMTSADENATAFKHAHQQYEQALGVQAQASVAFSEAQKQHEAAREVLEVAEAQFQKEKGAGLDQAALERRQQDFSELVASAKTDEVAWQNSRQQFDGATADVTLKRGKTLQALRSVSSATPSAAAPFAVPALPEIPTVVQENVRTPLIGRPSSTVCNEIEQQLARDQEAMHRQKKSIEQGQVDLVDWTSKNDEAQKTALKRAGEFLVSSLLGKLGEFNEGKLKKLEDNFRRRAPLGEVWQRKIQKVQEFHVVEARLKAAIDGIAIAGFIGTAGDGWHEVKEWIAKNGKDAEILDAILEEWQRDPEIRQIMKESGITTLSAGLGLSKTFAPWATGIDLGQFLAGYGYEATNWTLSKNRIEQQIANRDQDLKAVEALKKQIERTVAKLKACR